jgi:DnaA regulatory inactivator Hda
VAAPQAAAAPGPAAPVGAGEARQLALELPHATGASLADFLQAPCNEAALGAVLRWPDWPGPVLVLSGPPASGKTHLARIWAERARALTIAPEDASDPDRLLRELAAPDAAGTCAVDDADLLARDEDLLFHAHNAVVGRGGWLLLTAARPPAAWPVRLPDLRSRLMAAASVRIEPPDDTLLAALLVKQFADRQLRVEPAVVEYLVRRLERSFAAARAAAAALDHAALRAQRPVTLPLARAILWGEGAAAWPGGDEAGEPS